MGPATPFPAARTFGVGRRIHQDAQRSEGPPVVEREATRCDQRGRGHATLLQAAQRAERHQREAKHAPLDPRARVVGQAVGTLQIEAGDGGQKADLADQRVGVVAGVADARAVASVVEEFVDDGSRRRLWSPRPRCCRAPALPKRAVFTRSGASGGGGDGVSGSEVCRGDQVDPPLRPAEAQCLDPVSLARRNHRCTPHRSN